jgi:hypothetical protein
MAYITAEEVKTFLNIDLTANGSQIVESIIPGVEQYAENYCNRTWQTGSNDITETFDANGCIYFVGNPPVNLDETITVSVDGTALTTSEFFAYANYITLDSTPVRGNRNVVITYKSNATIPADLKHALIRWTAEIFKSAEDAGKTAKRVQFGPSEVEFLVQDGIPKFVQMVLDRYRLTPV